MQPIPHQMMLQMKLIRIVQLVSEIFIFESVNAQTDARTDGRRLESHPKSSSRAFGSVEIKIQYNFCISQNLNQKRA